MTDSVTFDGRLLEAYYNGLVSQEPLADSTYYAQSVDACLKEIDQAIATGASLRALQADLEKIVKGIDNPARKNTVQMDAQSLRTLYFRLIDICVRNEQYDKAIQYLKVVADYRSRDIHAPGLRQIFDLGEGNDPATVFTPNELLWYAALCGQVSAKVPFTNELPLVKELKDLYSINEGNKKQFPRLVIRLMLAKAGVPFTGDSLDKILADAEARRSVLNVKLFSDDPVVQQTLTNSLDLVIYLTVQELLYVAKTPEQVARYSGYVFPRGADLARLAKDVTALKEVRLALLPAKGTEKARLNSQETMWRTWFDKNKAIILMQLYYHKTMGNFSAGIALLDAYQPKLIQEEAELATELQFYRAEFLLQQAATMSAGAATVLSQIVVPKTKNVDERIRAFYIESALALAIGNKDKWLSLAVDNPASEVRGVLDPATFAVRPEFIAVEESTTRELRLNILCGLVEQALTNKDSEAATRYYAQLRTVAEAVDVKALATATPLQMRLIFLRAQVDRAAAETIYMAIRKAYAPELVNKYRLSEYRYNNTSVQYYWNATLLLAFLVADTGDQVRALALIDEVQKERLAAIDGRAKDVNFIENVYTGGVFLVVLNDLRKYKQTYDWVSAYQVIAKAKLLITDTEALKELEFQQAEFKELEYEFSPTHPVPPALTIELTSGKDQQRSVYIKLAKYAYEKNYVAMQALLQEVYVRGEFNTKYIETVDKNKELYNYEFQINILASIAELQLNPDFTGSAELALSAWTALQALVGAKVPEKMQNRWRLLQAKFEPEKALAIYQELYKLVPATITIQDSLYYYTAESSRMHWLATQMLMYGQFKAKAKAYTQANVYAQELIDTYLKNSAAADIGTMRDVYESALLLQAECAFALKTGMEDKLAAAKAAILPGSKNYLAVLDMQIRLARMSDDQALVVAQLLKLLTTELASPKNTAEILLHDYAVLAYQDAQRKLKLPVDETITLLAFKPHAKRDDYLRMYVSAENVYQAKLVVAGLSLLAKTAANIILSDTGDNDEAEQALEVLLDVADQPVGVDLQQAISAKPLTKIFDNDESLKTLKPRLRFDYAWTLIEKKVIQDSELEIVEKIALQFVSVPKTYAELTDETTREAYELYCLACTKTKDPKKLGIARNYYASIITALKTKSAKTVQEVQTLAAAIDNQLFILIYQIKDFSAALDLLNDSALTALFKTPQGVWLPQYAKDRYVCLAKLNKPQDIINISQTYLAYIQRKDIPASAVAAAADLLLMYAQDQALAGIPLDITEIEKQIQESALLSVVDKTYYNAAYAMLHVQAALSNADYTGAQKLLEAIKDNVLAQQTQKTPPYTHLYTQLLMAQATLAAQVGEFAKAQKLLDNAKASLANSTGDYTQAIKLQKAWTYVQEDTPLAKQQAESIWRDLTGKETLAVPFWAWNMKKTVAENKQALDLAKLAVYLLGPEDRRIFFTQLASSAAGIPADPVLASYKKRVLADAQLQLAQLYFYQAKELTVVKDPAVEFTKIAKKEELSPDSWTDYELLALAFDTKKSPLEQLTVFGEKLAVLGKNISLPLNTTRAKNILRTVDVLLSKVPAAEIAALETQLDSVVPEALKTYAVYYQLKAHCAERRQDFVTAAQYYEKIIGLAQSGVSKLPGFDFRVGQDMSAPQPKEYTLADIFWAKVNLASMYRILGQVSKLSTIPTFTVAELQSVAAADSLTYPLIMSIDAMLLEQDFNVESYMTAVLQLNAVRFKLKPEDAQQKKLLSVKLIDICYELGDTKTLQDLIEQNKGTEIANRATIVLMKLVKETAPANTSDTELAMAIQTVAKAYLASAKDDPTVGIEFALQKSTISGLNHNYIQRLLDLQEAEAKISALPSASTEELQAKNSYQKLLSLLYAYHFVEVRDFVQAKIYIDNLTTAPTDFSNGTLDEEYILKAKALLLEMLLTQADYSGFVAEVRKQQDDYIAFSKSGLPYSLQQASAVYGQAVGLAKQKYTDKLFSLVSIPAPVELKYPETTLIPSVLRSQAIAKAKASSVYVPAVEFDWTKVQAQFVAKLAEYAELQKTGSFWDKKQIFDELINIAIQLGLTTDVFAAINILYFPENTAQVDNSGQLAKLATDLRKDPLLNQTKTPFFNKTEIGYALFSLFNAAIATEQTELACQLASTFITQCYGVSQFSALDKDAYVDEPLLLFLEAIKTNKLAESSDAWKAVLTLPQLTLKTKPAETFAQYYTQYTSPTILNDKVAKLALIEKIIEQLGGLSAELPVDQQYREALILEMLKDLTGYALAENSPRFNGKIAELQKYLDSITDAEKSFVTGIYGSSKYKALAALRAYIQAQFVIDNDLDRFKNPDQYVKALFDQLGGPEDPLVHPLYAIIDPEGYSASAAYVAPKMTSQQSAHADTIAQAAHWYLLMYQNTRDEKYRQKSDQLRKLLVDIYKNYDIKYFDDAYVRAGKGGFLRVATHGSFDLAEQTQHTDFSYAAAVPGGEVSGNTIDISKQQQIFGVSVEGGYADPQGNSISGYLDADFMAQSGSGTKQTANLTGNGMTADQLAAGIYLQPDGTYTSSAVPVLGDLSLQKASLGFDANINLLNKSNPSDISADGTVIGEMKNPLTVNSWNLGFGGNLGLSQTLEQNTANIFNPLAGLYLSSALDVSPKDSPNLHLVGDINAYGSATRDVVETTETNTDPATGLPTTDTVLANRALMNYGLALNLGAAYRTNLFNIGGTVGVAYDGSSVSEPYLGGDLQWNNEGVFSLNLGITGGVTLTDWLQLSGYTHFGYQLGYNQFLWKDIGLSATFGLAADKELVLNIGGADLLSPQVLQAMSASTTTTTSAPKFSVGLSFKLKL